MVDFSGFIIARNFLLPTPEGFLLAPSRSGEVSGGGGGRDSNKIYENVHALCMERGNRERWKKGGKRKILMRTQPPAWLSLFCRSLKCAQSKSISRKTWESIYICYIYRDNIECSLQEQKSKRGRKRQNLIVPGFWMTEGAVTAYSITLRGERRLVSHQGSRRAPRIAARDKQANTNKSFDEEVLRSSP